ncbi:MAG: hypothetical protein WCR86_08760 [Parabacteroides sp.]
MKRMICLILISLILGSVISFGQEKQNRYFFKDFQPMTVYYKDGRTFIVAGNYDLMDGSFVFIDKQDNNRLKWFGEQDQIGCVRTATRTFQATRFGLTEILRPDPELLVVYKPKIFEGKKDIGYGVKVSAGAVRTYNSVLDYGKGGTSVHPLDTSEQEWVGSMDKVYKIKIKGVEKSFETIKHFQKLYPKQKNQINKYLAEHPVNFKETKQVAGLFIYADSIAKSQNQETLYHQGKR